MFKFLFGNKAYNGISALDYQQTFVEGKQPHTLVDVRTKGEYARGHLPGSINIPLDQLDNPKKLKRVAGDKPVVVCCATGNRSRIGANAFAKAGYENIYNLRGGLTIWRAKGLPVEN